MTGPDGSLGPEGRYRLVRRIGGSGMVLLRAGDEGADYLALADATLLLDTVDGLQVVSDARVNQLAGKEREAANRVPTGSALKLRRRAQLTRALRRAWNRPGGYWVAAADPQAASQAVTGSLPRKNLHRAVLLSDGASRLVDPFRLATWEELLALLDENGPEELLRQVRAAEAVDPKAGSGLGPSAATTRPLSISTSTRRKPRIRPVGRRTRARCRPGRGRQGPSRSRRP
jgi:hypothetical protein